MKYSELENGEGESSGQKLSEEAAPEDCMQKSKRGGWRTFPYIIGIIQIWSNFNQEFHYSIRHCNIFGILFAHTCTEKMQGLS